MGNEEKIVHDVSLGSWSKGVCVHVCIYIYIHIYVHKTHPHFFPLLIAMCGIFVTKPKQNKTSIQKVNKLKGRGEIFNY